MRLHHRKALNELFEQGKGKTVFPLRVLSHESDALPHQVVFVVPKRRIPHAVTRNHIRRKLREIYRQHQHLLAKLPPHHFAFVYLDKHPSPTYNKLEKAMQGLIVSLIEPKP